MSNATYLKREEGNATVFEVTPATASKLWWFLIIGAILLVAGIADLNAYSHSKLKTAEPTWILIVFPGILLLWLGYRDWRPKAHRRPSTFSVTADSVTTNGVTIKKNDIHRLIVRNPKSATGEVAVVTVGSPLPMFGNVAGKTSRLRDARVCNSLDLEAGGKAYVLAGGMDETTVFGLLSDVSALLGLRVQ